MLGGASPLFADDGLQLWVVDDDTESSRHSGGTLQEPIAARELHTAPVFLCRNAQGRFEALITLVPHQDPWADVAEDLAAIDSAVNDDLPRRIDLRSQTSDGERPLRSDFLPGDPRLAPRFPPLSIPNAPQGRLCGLMLRRCLSLEPTPPHFASRQCFRQGLPLRRLPVLQRLSLSRRCEGPEGKRNPPVPSGYSHSRAYPPTLFPMRGCQCAPLLFLPLPQRLSLLPPRCSKVRLLAGEPFRELPASFGPFCTSRQALRIIPRPARPPLRKTLALDRFFVCLPRVRSPGRLRGRFHIGAERTFQRRLGGPAAEERGLGRENPAIR
jgi:hypothetical protein